MKLKELQDIVIQHDGFKNFMDCANFAGEFLRYINDSDPTVIVSQNEYNYHFFQFDEESKYAISRPFNSDLIVEASEFEKSLKTVVDYFKLLKDRKEKAKDYIDNPILIDRVLYTIQQTVGFALDTLNSNNKARKVNGDIFELLMLYVMNEIGVDAIHGVFPMDIRDSSGEKLFKMNWQHDMVVHHKNELTPSMIGSVKTTSKDRISKVFMDKYLYNRLSETETAHIAIFLHDVQRANGKYKRTLTGKGNLDVPLKFKVSQTFLTGHFKAYTMKINPMDGVYYMDMRPVFQTDELLKKQIKRFNTLLIDDIWSYVS